MSFLIKKSLILSVAAFAAFFCLLLCTSAFAGESEVREDPVMEEIFLPNENARLESYLEKQTGGEDAKQKKFVGKLLEASVPNTLEGLNSELRAAIYEKIQKIARGEETYTSFTVQIDTSDLEGCEWTASDLQIETLITEQEGSISVSPQVHTAMKRITGYDSKRVILSLVNQCMSELYWFGLGYYCGYPYEVVFSQESGEYVVRMTGEVQVILSVSPDYSLRDENGDTIRYTTDPGKIDRVNKAVENAHKIAKEADAFETDREKLKFFYDKIYELSGYDFVAAAGAPYGDPWQIINVFDMNPETMVVCEGYSKAFQLLCDMTKFNSSEVSCICVTGYQTWDSSQSLPVSTHMWNVVHIDGGNYLVDITNGGGREDLFLASCSKGNMEKGYYIDLRGMKVKYRYIYSDDIRSVFPDTALRLAGEEGVPQYQVLTKGFEDNAKKTLCIVRKDAYLKTEENIEKSGGLFYEDEDIYAEYANESEEARLFQIIGESGEILDSRVIFPGQTGSVSSVKLQCNVTLELEKASIPLSELILKTSKAIYTGKAIRIDKALVVNAIVNGEKVTLKPGTDYTVKYTNNINAGKTAKVTVTGKGFFTGSKSKTFTIEAKQVTPSISVTKSFVYNGNARKPAVTVKAGKTILKNGTDYTVIYSKGCKAVGTYKIAVKLKNNYSGSKTISFKIVPKKTAVVKAEGTKNGFTVRWKKQSTQTSGYQIQYSTSRGFKSGNKMVTLTSNTTTLKKITNLKAKQKYFVKVRTYKTIGGKKYYSEWSKVKAVKTK